MDLARLLTHDEASYLAGFSTHAIARMGSQGAELYLPEIVPVAPNQFSLTQVFGLWFIKRVRKDKTWNQTCALSCGRWLMSRDPFELADLFSAGHRHAVAMQNSNPKSPGDERDAVHMPLDSGAIQEVIALLKPKADQWKMRLTVSEVGNRWDEFLAHVRRMDTPPTGRAGLN